MLPPLPVRLLCSIMLRHAVALGWLYIESEETVCLLSQMEGHRKETVFNAQVGEGGTARLEPIGMVLKATSALYAHPCDSAATKWILKMQHKATFEDLKTNDSVLLIQVALRLQTHDGHPMCPVFSLIRLRGINHGHLQNTHKCGVEENWAHTARKSRTDATRLIVKTIVVQQQNQDKILNENQFPTKVDCVYLNSDCNYGFKNHVAEQNTLFLLTKEEAEVWPGDFGQKR